MNRLLIVFAVAVFACGADPAELQRQLPINGNTDTVYSTSTRNLKSDQIPDSVFRLSELRHLSISGMDCHHSGNDCWMITEIPAQLKNLENLRTLSLTLHAIQKLPGELATLKHLESLELTDNANLSDIDVIARMPSLEYLYLYGCRLQKLPPDLSGLKNLRRLGLTGNNLSDEELNRIRIALPGCEIIFGR
jgi:Leucine-rich repeat (LRR) protein